MLNNINLNELIFILTKIQNMKWIKSISNGTSGAGLTFEKLLGKNADNFELPDFKGIEIKTKYAKRNLYVHLFKATPDSYLFEIKRIHKKYGYPDRTNPKYKVFNISIFANKLIYISNNYCMKIYVDWQRKKVFLNVYDLELNLIDNLTSWSFELLNEKLLRKFKLFLFVKSKRKVMHGEVYYKYEDAFLYNLKNFSEFLKLIDLGHIRVTFGIGVFTSGKKIGQIHDHGTSFDICEDYLNQLFDLIYTFSWDQRE